MMIRRAIASLMLAGLMVFGAAGPARACPSCKEAMASQAPSEAARLRSGYFYSIVLMVAMPITLTGVGFYCVRRAVKSGGIPEL